MLNVQESFYCISLKFCSCCDCYCEWFYGGCTWITEFTYIGWCLWEITVGQHCGQHGTRRTCWKDYRTCRNRMR